MMQAIDLFSGAGGMSTGANMCGINVRYAVELDQHAANSFKLNHKNTQVVNRDIRQVSAADFKKLDRSIPLLIFGGPPCRGFSTSNQRTRTVDNKNNWLFREYLRLVTEMKPDWLVFENVKGLIETENGFFLREVISGFESSGYTTSSFVLNSADYGVPQKRNRLFIIGSRQGRKVDPPSPTSGKYITVAQAIEDLPLLENGDACGQKEYAMPARTQYAKRMRNDLKSCSGNLVTNSSPLIIRRFSHIPQGGNWENIPKRLMKNYADVTRCHTGIYHRLRDDEPSIVIGNFRKNMLIHPWKDRGLSVREAARLQSFPDWFEFSGTIGFQQQQVGNAVPPLLAKAVFSLLIDGTDKRG